MIHFEDVSYWYPQTERPALQHVSFDLYEGAFALVVGHSGAGKSTLLRCLNGLVPHFTGGIIQGKIKINGLNPIITPPQSLSQHVGFVFQDPEAQFVMDNVEDELAFALENAALPRQEMRIRVEEVLDLLDLASMRDRRLETLSGGEKQRVAIGAALALRPRILVLDEPTSQLDPKSAEDVLHALTRLNSDLGLTIVLAEHRLERVVHFVDQVLYLPPAPPPPAIAPPPPLIPPNVGGETRGGGGGNFVPKPLLIGSPHEVLPEIDLLPPLLRVGKALGWKPLPLTVKEGRRFSRRIEQEFSDTWKATSEKKGFSQGFSDTWKATSARKGLQERGFLEMKGVEVRYGKCSVLRGVDLAVQAGEVVVLMGRNGAGKSTLLKSLVGLVREERGQIRVAGLDASQHDVATLSRHVGYLPQDPNALLFADTVREELEITLRNHGLLSESLSMQPEGLLALLGLADKANAYPRDLSAGERQRVALAAILITQPKALLLDEPTRGIDYLAKEELVRLLRTWRNEGIAILLVTHDVEFAATIADRVILMSQGELIANGTPAQVMASSPLFAPQIARLFPQSGWLTAEDVINN